MNMTVEEKALKWARKQKGNVLNNRNVDCFIAGYEMAREEYQKILNLQELKKLPPCQGQVPYQNLRLIFYISIL